MTTTSGNRRKAKRANNTGTVFHAASEGRWRAQFHDASGKLRHLSGRTEQEVVARLERAIAERDKGILGLAPGETPTVAQWMDIWLASKYDLKPKTLQRYRLDIDLYIKPHLGAVRVDQVKAPMIEALYALLLQQNGLAPSTVRHVHSTLSAALRQASNHDVTPIPVILKVKAPKVPEPRREAIDQDSVIRLLALTETRGAAVAARWRLAFLWAIRQGEALGLRWSDVDLDTGVVTIRQQMQYFSGEGMRPGSPKAESSRRRFKVDPATLALLKDVRREQLTRKIAATKWQDHDLVFCTDEGKPIDTSNDRRQFKRLLRACGIEDYRVHDARHTAITNMVMDGTPLATIQRIAGHSDIRTTIGYVHLTDEAYETAAAGVERRFA